MLLNVDKIKKSYDDNLIFENLSFTVDKGEIVTFQGRSGEGKTTVIRCISALEKVDSGTISIDNIYLCKTENNVLSYCSKENLKKYRMHIGMVFQNFNLFPHMTMMENLVEAPKFHGKDTEDEIEKRASSLIYELDLTCKENFYPHQLSGGQKQRVAIARACMLSPKILCFDEPTSALDEENRDTIENIIKNLAKKDMGIIIITHDSIFANNVSDTIFHLKNKELKEVK